MLSSARAPRLKWPFFAFLGPPPFPRSLCLVHTSINLFLIASKHYYLQYNHMIDRCAGCVFARASLGRVGRQSKLVLYLSQGHRLLYGTVSTSCPSEAAYHEFKTIRPPSCRAPCRGTGGMTWPRAFARSDPGGTPSSSTYHVLPQKDALVDRSSCVRQTCHRDACRNCH